MVLDTSIVIAPNATLVFVVDLLGGGQQPIGIAEATCPKRDAPQLGAEQALPSECI